MVNDCDTVNSIKQTSLGKFTRFFNEKGYLIPFQWLLFEYLINNNKIKLADFLENVSVERPCFQFNQFNNYKNVSPEFKYLNGKKELPHNKVCKVHDCLVVNSIMLLRFEVKKDEVQYYFCGLCYLLHNLQFNQETKNENYKKCKGQITLLYIPFFEQVVSVQTSVNNTLYNLQEIKRIAAMDSGIDRFQVQGSASQLRIDIVSSKERGPPVTVLCM